MYPPTKKNTGITCSTQVATQRPRVKPIRLAGDTISGETTRIVNTQCHITTTTSENERRKSTN